MATDVLPAPLNWPKPWKIGGLLGGLLGLWLALTTVTSNVFQAEVTDTADLRAFPGCEGFGCETTHGRGGTVCIVTNLNDTGAGSFRSCVLQTSPRIVIFRVSGTIPVTSVRIDLQQANSNIYIAGQTAPGDGIALRHNVTTGFGDGPLMQFYNTDDVVIRYIRFRHGAPTGSASATADNFAIRGGNNNMVFDHNSITWTGDEAYSIFASSGGVNNVTFSRNLIAHGVVYVQSGSWYNQGPLWSGGPSVRNITSHHNYYAHWSYRNPRMATSSSTNGDGVHIINEIVYNANSQFASFAQNFYHNNSETLYADVRNSWFAYGPDSVSRGQNPVPVLAARSSADTGQQPMSFYLVGNTKRNQDGTSHATNNEANNWAAGMFGTQQQGFGLPTYVQRNSPISSQPTHPVTIQSAQDAYTSVVTNEDVGANKPAMDSVDQGFIDDHETNGGWSTTKIPPPWGSASYPVLSTYNVPTDTDNDGVPDAFETGTLGTNPSVFEQQAQLDHDGDGYTNIEEWIESL